RFADLGPRGDLLHRRAVDPALGEQGAPDADQLLPALGARHPAARGLRFAGHGPDSVSCGCLWWRTRSPTMGTTGSDSEVVVPVRGRVAALVGAVAAL